MTDGNIENNQNELSHEVWFVHKFFSEAEIEAKLTQQLKIIAQNVEVALSPAKLTVQGSDSRQTTEIETKVIENVNKTIVLAHKDKTDLTNNNSEPWASRWIAVPIGYLCSKEEREEWLGDLYEVIREMHTKNYPKWTINLICVGKTAILIFSAFEIKISDFLALLKKS